MFKWERNPICPGEGTDPRRWRWLICNLQNNLSTISTIEPLSITFAFPPFVAIVIPLFYQGWYLNMRLGFRYDRNNKMYIFPEGAIKLMKSTVIY